MTSCFAFYISQWAMEPENIRELINIKEVFNTKIAEKRKDLQEKTQWAKEAREIYNFKRDALAANTEIIFKAHHTLVDAEWDRDLAKNSLILLEIEVEICNAFCSFVRRCYAAEQDAETVIKDAVAISSGLKTREQILEFWVLSE